MPKPSRRQFGFHRRSHISDSSLVSSNPLKVEMKINWLTAFADYLVSIGKILLNLVLIVLGCAILYFSIKDIREAKVYIHPFSVPDSFSESGLTGIVLAEQVLDQIKNIRNGAAGTVEGKNYLSHADYDAPEILVPGIGISIRILTDYF